MYNDIVGIIPKGIIADIDKAYIMGQSYDDNAIYIGWSPYFNYDSLETLQASKTLPIPKGIKITKGDYDVTALINDVDFNNLDAVNIKRLATLIRTAEQHPGIKYEGDQNILNDVINKLNAHEFSKIPQNLQEAAFKNVASANIYQVSHDIRNRDQAYTAIALDMMHKAADKSPKGNQAATLNMLNPYTKYIMQYQNLVGKNVISIAANGEKVWFNMFYYWTKVLKSGKNIDRLKFSQTFNRIKGRAENKIDNTTVTTLPDLNLYDVAIKNALLSEFSIGSQEYKYVDQLISQLLSAATDNAKELILAKINAGTNFAKMYVYSMMVGLDINDTVAFMTCPVSELIDKLAQPNMFENYNGSPNQAINMVQGIVGVDRRLHGTVKSYTKGENGDEKTDVNKNTYLAGRLRNAYPKLITEDIKGLSQIMKLVINAAIEDETINLKDIKVVDDLEINSYMQECQDLIGQLRNVRKQYASKEDMMADIQEFKKLYDLSSEISTVSSAWLGLNQGMPTAEIDILSRLNKMSRIVSDRENILGVKDNEMFREKTPTLEAVVENIRENNPTLTNIEERLKAAHEAGIINNFDIVRYLKDNDYRQQIIDYYGLLMGTVNVFDMIENLPNYHTILELFNSVVTANNSLVAKSRLINSITNKMENIDEKQLRGVVRYVDNLIAFNFLQDKTSIQVKNVEGFDQYFNKTKVSRIDLYSLNGISTFKHWVEHEFLDELKAINNPLVPHLALVPNNDMTILATDIDLMNPSITEESKKAYEDILRGIAEFENTPYNNSGYSIADILMLYNIAVNKNQYGAERLTTIFKSCKDPNNIINQYFKYEAELDYSGLDLEYDNKDYLINTAPIISSFAEKYHKEPYIKVKDAVQGLILKRYDARNNIYYADTRVPVYVEDEDETSRLNRLQNFVENCPFEMPNMYATVRLTQLIDYNGSLEEALKHIEDVKNLLIQYSSSSKALIIVDC